MPRKAKANKYGERIMKKSIIALAVAGAMTAPMISQADAVNTSYFRQAGYWPIGIPDEPWKGKGNRKMRVK